MRNIARGDCVHPVKHVALHVAQPASIRTAGSLAVYVLKNLDFEASRAPDVRTFREIVTGGMDSSSPCSELYHRVLWAAPGHRGMMIVTRDMDVGDGD
jgi:hypothetical protein